MTTTCIRTFRRSVVAVLRLPARIHRDQHGTISIVSVFAVMLLAMLLGMVMNVGREVDGKIRMQNSADAAAYSGGVVLARGLNNLAFTNHLLCDVFALTAFLREARDRNSDALAPEILDAWANVAPKFSGSGFPKFEALGSAISNKVPLERQLVSSYSEWAAAASARILPLMEEILAGELIPQYQRAVVEAFPDIAQMAAMEVSRINGAPENGRGELQGVLWRATGVPVGGANELVDPTFPAVDPAECLLDDPGDYIRTARHQRRRLSHRYLRDWNNQAMRFFDREGKMSQFGMLWRSFTCGYLEHLLEVEYPYTNLPHVIRRDGRRVTDRNRYLEDNFVFIATVYWRKVPQMLPGLFRNPMDSDAVAYAEVHLFIPRPRLVWQWHSPGGGDWDVPIGGVPGDFYDLPGGENPEPGGDGFWRVGRQGVPTHWDLLNQHWTCQLAPATQSTLVDVLQTPPMLPHFNDDGLVLPDLGSLTSEDVGRISPH